MADLLLFVKISSGVVQVVFYCVFIMPNIGKKLHCRKSLIISSHPKCPEGLGFAKCQEYVEEYFPVSEQLFQLI